jgi:hypothetical protein
LKNKEGSNCLDDDNFREKFKRKKLTYYYVETNLDFDNNKHPFDTLLQNHFIFMNSFLGNFITYIYTNLAVESDFGILFSSSEKQYSIKHERLINNYMLNEHSFTYNKNDINIASVMIQFSEHVDYHKRVYYKLQHVFAEVGGILNGILLFGRLSVFLFSKTFFYENLSNDYFYNYLEQENVEGKKVKLEKFGIYINKNDNRRNNDEYIDQNHKNTNMEINGINSNYRTYLQKRWKSKRDKIKFDNIINNADHSNYEKRNYTNNIMNNRASFEEIELNSNLTNPGIPKIIVSEASISKSNNIIQNKSNNFSDVDFDNSNISKMPLKENEKENILDDNAFRKDFKTNPNTERINKSKSKNKSNRKSSGNQNNNENLKSNNLVLENNLNKNKQSNLILGKVDKKLIGIEKPTEFFTIINSIDLSNNAKANKSIKGLSKNLKDSSERLNINNHNKNENLGNKKNLNFEEINESDAYLALMGKKVNITCKSFLLSLFCPAKYLSLEIQKNKQVLFKFSNMLNKFLELDNILNSYKNIELIKTLFFNEKQRLALKYVKFEFDDSYKEKDIQKEFDIIKEYFQSKKTPLSENDIKILQMLNNELFNFKF